MLPFENDNTYTVHAKGITEGQLSIGYNSSTGMLTCAELIENDE